MTNPHLTRVESIEPWGRMKNSRPFRGSSITTYPTWRPRSSPLAARRRGWCFHLEEGTEVWTINPSIRRTLKAVHLGRIFVLWGSNVFHRSSTFFPDYGGFAPGATSIPADAFFWCSGRANPFLEVLSHSPRLGICSLYFAIPQDTGSSKSQFPPPRGTCPIRQNLQPRLPLKTLPPPHYDKGSSRWTTSKSSRQPTHHIIPTCLTFSRPCNPVGPSTRSCSRTPSLARSWGSGT